MISSNNNNNDVILTISSKLNDAVKEITSVITS